MNTPDGEPTEETATEKLRRDLLINESGVMIMIVVTLLDKWAAWRGR